MVSGASVQRRWLRRQELQSVRLIRVGKSWMCPRPRAFHAAFQEPLQLHHDGRLSLKNQQKLFLIIF